MVACWCVTRPVCEDRLGQGSCAKAVLAIHYPNDLRKIIHVDGGARARSGNTPGFVNGLVGAPAFDLAWHMGWMAAEPLCNLNVFHSKDLTCIAPPFRIALGTLQQALEPGDLSTQAGDLSLVLGCIDVKAPLV
ncbi:hypothetical protein EGJ89_10360 [Stenotrophomonas maltophilia]|nr:hypothetical protein EGJ89_10360 [Stenotrophomonas maltophilia]